MVAAISFWWRRRGRGGGRCSGRASEDWQWTSPPRTLCTQCEHWTVHFVHCLISRTLALIKPPHYHAFPHSHNNWTIAQWPINTKAMIIQIVLCTSQESLWGPPVQTKRKHALENGIKYTCFRQPPHSDEMKWNKCFDLRVFLIFWLMAWMEGEWIHLKSVCSKLNILPSWLFHRASSPVLLIHKQHFLPPPSFLSLPPYHRRQYNIQTKWYKKSSF